MKTFILLILSVYTVILMGIEVSTSQDHVRHYFTDIEGPVVFYAINTSLSVFLQWSAALIFGMCILTLSNKTVDSKKRLFYLSQIVMFSIIATDDRFMFHERVDHFLGFDGGLFLVLLGMIEVYLLLKLGDFLKMPKSLQFKIYVAAVLFAVMLVFDMLMPQGMLLRLSVEDLCKTWASFFLAWFAWEICARNIDDLKGRNVQIEVG